MKNFTLILSLFLGFKLFGCLQSPPVEQSFGPEFDKSTVENSFNELKSASPYSIEIGEFAYLEKLQQIENNPADIIFQRGDTVTGKKEESDHYVLTLVSEIRELIDGSLKPSRTENEAILPKPTSVEQLANTLTKSFSKNQTALKSFATAYKTASSYLKEDQAQKVTFHNLEIKKILYPVPDLTKKRSNCGGLSSEHCKNGIPSVQVSFDRVTWEPRGGDKSSFRFVVSEHSPYLASQLSACVQSKIDFQGQRVRVTQCELIKDFTWGTQAVKINKTTK